jgi:hypothetical protein
VARFPIRAVGHSATVNDIAISRLFERHQRVPRFQTVLYHRRIVLVDFATERGNGYLHIFAAQRIANLILQISWRSKSEI